MIKLQMILLVLILSTRLSGKAIIVPDDFVNISEAINNSQAGDTVFVKKGIYKERLELKSGIQLRGEDRDKVQVVADANNKTEIVLVKDSNNVLIESISFDGMEQANNVFIIQKSSVVITGCKVSNSGGCGITVYGGSNVKLSNCEISQNINSGVYIEHEKGAVKITDCKVLNNKKTGIYIEGCKNIELSDNKINFNGTGIYLGNSGGKLLIKNNKIKENEIGLNSKNSKEILFERNIAEGNLKEGIIIWGGSQGTVVKNSCLYNGRDGIYVCSDKTDIKLLENNCQSNKLYGIAVGEKATCYLEKNNCDKNYHNGIAVMDGAKGNIKGGTCNFNGEGGIHVEDANTSVDISESEIKGNNFSGIYFTGGATGSIINNKCSGNLVSGIYIKNTGKVDINNNVCLNNKIDGISIMNVNDFNCENNQFTDNFQNGILAHGIHNGKIVKNICSKNRYHGISIKENTIAEVKGNNCTFNGWSGIVVFKSKGICQVSDNICLENYNWGISIDEKGKALIKGNTCENNIHEGIVVMEIGSEAEIVNNTCRYNNHSGIFFCDGGTGIARMNVCEGHPWSGIAVRGDVKPVIENNKCTNNSVWQVVYWNNDDERGLRSLLNNH